MAVKIDLSVEAFQFKWNRSNIPCDAMLTDAIFSVALATAGAVASETPGESYE